MPQLDQEVMLDDTSCKTRKDVYFVIVRIDYMVEQQVRSASNHRARKFIRLDGPVYRACADRQTFGDFEIVGSIDKTDID
jgi:hypothetical protein